MKGFFKTLPLLLILSSCFTKKDWVYFQGQQNQQTELQNFDLKYQPNDLLSINVTSLDLDAARPFNLYVSSPLTDDNLILTTQLRQQTYLVDKNGRINFPILGSLTIGGLTRDAATQLLENKLKNYLKEPVVTLRLTNFRVSILGEVNMPGAYTIFNERISILEAIALAGDLTINGKRENVLLIREENGVMHKHYIDLRNDSFFNSKFFFLKPNDVLYIEPNTSKVRSSTDALRFTSISLSLITTITTILSILLR